MAVKYYQAVSTATVHLSKTRFVVLYCGVLIQIFQYVLFQSKLHVNNFYLFSVQRRIIYTVMSYYFLVSFLFLICDQIISKSKLSRLKKKKGLSSLIFSWREGHITYVYLLTTLPQWFFLSTNVFTSYLHASGRMMRCDACDLGLRSSYYASQLKNQHQRILRITISSVDENQ